MRVYHEGRLRSSYITIHSRKTHLFHLGNRSSSMIKCTDCAGTGTLSESLPSKCTSQLLRPREARPSVGGLTSWA